MYRYNYYPPGTDVNKLDVEQYSGIITYEYEESAEAQRTTQVVKEIGKEAIKALPKAIYYGVMLLAMLHGIGVWVPG